jgi:hypothetical protein
LEEGLAIGAPGVHQRRLAELGLLVMTPTLLRVLWVARRPAAPQFGMAA